jgi:phasin family protein
MTVMETLKDKTGAILSSAGDFNKLAIDKVEEAVKLNLASVSYFSDVSVKQLRAMSAIRDMDSLRRFTADTISLSGEVAKKMLDDSKAWMSLGTDMKEKVADMFAKPEESDIKKKMPVKSVVSN